MQKYSVFSATLDSPFRQQMLEKFGSAAEYTRKEYGFACFLFPTTTAATLGEEDPNAIKMDEFILVDTEAEKETPKHMTWDEFDAWADYTMQQPPIGIQIDFDKPQCKRLKKYHLDQETEI